MAGRRRRKRRTALWMTVAAVALISLAIAYAALASRGRGNADPLATRAPSPTLMQVPTPTPELTAVPDATPEPTTRPTKAADFSTVEPDEVSATDDPHTCALTQDDYLPVYRKADTDRKVIAITVDDLYQSGNAQTIVDLAIKYGGKLTLFPIGENALRDELGKTLRYAHERGMEIENHTYEHLGLYKLDDDQMARQVYLQGLAIDYVLGVDYQQHFFRPYGGDGLDDQRTHLYCRQMGITGIAYWTVSGSDTEADKLMGTLAPGNVYLFHSTDADTKKLKKFIPAAVKAGYELVTMNELFGLPDNEVEELKGSVDPHDIPPVIPYKLAPRDYKKGDFMWAVNLIQQRLISLGYMNGTADGVYGKSTEAAISAFQGASGLSRTGTADLPTQDALFTPSAKRGGK